MGLDAGDRSKDRKFVTLPRRTFALYLAMTPGLGGKSVTRVLTRNELLSRSPEQFLGYSPQVLKEEYRLSHKAIESILGSGKNRVEEIVELERKLSGLGVAWVTSADVHYPALIEAMDSDPPGVLFLYGNLKLLDAQTFCVLSSRNSRPADHDLIETLTEEAVLKGEVLVTGTNTPEYQRSAVVPLRWGAPRILCLDNGLFKTLGDDLKQEAFPAARLWRYEFDPSTDLVVSPFRPYDDFLPGHNKIRDLLIGCLSQRLDFVSVSERGNMQKIAIAALKAGRSVGVSDRIVGYREYLNQGARKITT